MSAVPPQNTRERKLREYRGEVMGGFEVSYSTTMTMGVTFEP